MKLITLATACLAAISLQAELFFSPSLIAKHLETYTEAEVKLIKKDLEVVRSVCFGDKEKTDSRYYLATAGAPGARKTTILEKFVALHPEYQDGVYIDFDPRTLRFMVHTYYAESLNYRVISEVQDYTQVIKNAYEKWRPASHYILRTLMEEAVASQRSIVFGTTSTDPRTPVFFEKLKQQGYQIVLLLCSCPDQVRHDAIEYRNDVVRFYQSSPEEAVSKGKVFPGRMGAYFDYADLLYFYWSDALFSPERLAAVWQDGKLEIHDEEAMRCFIDKYEADRRALAEEGQIIPSFESYLEKTNGSNNRL